MNQIIDKLIQVNIFTIKKCLCGVVKSTGSALKSQLFCNGYRLVTVGDGPQTFGNEFA